MLLPPHWIVPLETTAFAEYSKEVNYWPIRWLITIARFPHIYPGWVRGGVAVPCCKDEDTFAENTALSGMLLLPSPGLPFVFHKLRISDEKTINFYCLFPLYKEELEFKRKNDLGSLMIKLSNAKVSPVVATNRPNACRLA